MTDIGRFASRYPLDNECAGMPYSYVCQNPLMKSDPTGMSWLTDLALACCRSMQPIEYNAQLSSDTGTPAGSASNFQFHSPGHA